MRVLAAPDKFKGTASASQIASAICSSIAAAGAGDDCRPLPLADGGEGTLAALGGPNRISTVMGPAGAEVEAEWRLERGLAVIEMAQAAGLVLAGGAEGNDPLEATTRGVGQLIDEAIDAGADSIVVAVGGSATTDGGLGAIEALGSPARLQGVDVSVACDVRTPFLDAASVFGPQKGASPAQVELLSRRLERLGDRYRVEFGVDVTELTGAGAAGGLAGGLAALGARLVDGFDVVATHLGLVDAIEESDAVITGEGFVDAESFEGKVVGGVVSLAAANDVPVWVIAGQVFDGAERQVRAISLAERFGLEAALADPVSAVERVVSELVKSDDFRL